MTPEIEVRNIKPEKRRKEKKVVEISSKSSTGHTTAACFTLYKNNSIKLDIVDDWGSHLSIGQLDIRTFNKAIQGLRAK